MRLMITTDTVGGVWSFGMELAEGLLEAGDCVALVSFGPAATEAQRAECDGLGERWGDRFEFADTAIPLEWMQQNDSCMEQGVQALQRIGDAFGAELLHSNQFCYGSSVAGMPTLVTAHSDVFSWARCCGQALEPSPWLRRYRELVQQGLDGAGAVVAPTRWMMDVLRQEFAFDATAEVIANGRSLRVPAPQTGPLRAVSAGRLWDCGKGLAVLRDVASPMPIAVAGELCGEGAPANMPANITLRGLLQRDELFQLFAESAVYVCTSIYEPFGLAPLEAAMCGCAVIARDVPSLHEVWGNAAFYFRDEDELSALLTKLYTSPNLLQNCREQAQRRAHQYTRERMVSAYRNLYEYVANAERVLVA